MIDYDAMNWNLFGKSYKGNAKWYDKINAFNGLKEGCKIHINEEVKNVNICTNDAYNALIFDKKYPF